jgi:hypothetical protein
MAFRTQHTEQRTRLTSLLARKGIAATAAPKKRERLRRRFPKDGESVLDEQFPVDPEVDAFLITIFVFIFVFGMLLSLVYVAPGFVSRMTGLEQLYPMPNPQIPNSLTFVDEAP